MAQVSGVETRVTRLVVDDAEVKPSVHENLPFRQHGTFHFAIQDPDVEGLVAKIVAGGGKQRMPIREYFPGEKPYRMVYVEDPFGIVFEIYSHSYELTYSAGAYS
jgi:uncharacterized glyoxalase superfamily protein PhnB